MKKLNIVFSFVLLSFCLLINVSTAIEINQLFSSSNISNNPSGYTQTTLDTIGSYTLVDAQSILADYLTTGNNTEFNKLLSSIYSTHGENRYVLYGYLNDAGDTHYCTLYTFSSETTDIGKFGQVLGLVSNSKFHYINFNYGADNSSAFWECQYTNTNLNLVYRCARFSTSTNIFNKTGFFLEGNIDVKNMTYRSSSSSYYWDGTSYYYQAPEVEEPETPTMPTNAEIASAVQMFYNSDLYKNNTNFKDFMVVYSFSTGYYSFIGTDNHLLQEIYYDGAKPSNDDFTYPETWWRFYNYLGNLQNLFYGSDYWLYSTLKVDDVLSPIKYDGVGKLNNLFNLKFTNQSVIVYSSYEYEVYEYWPPESDYEIETGTNKKEVTTIPGDQYTYDETLDPTDSEYSPIQNYIPVNPSQTIISDVDVSEINKTFEENKGILNIENASWLFTANNKLISYFIGFLSLLIVFLIISRALGG